MPSEPLGIQLESAQDLTGSGPLSSAGHSYGRGFFLESIFIPLSSLLHTLGDLLEVLCHCAADKNPGGCLGSPSSAS